MPEVIEGAVTGSGGPADDVAVAGIAAAEMFGSALPTAERYAQLLTSAGVLRGIVGPGEAERIWDRHLLNCGAVARLVPAKCSLIDLGSGAGLPGIVLAMLVPGAAVTLVEPLARRVEFLAECVASLELANVEVVRGRAEELVGQLTGDVVTARAVAPLDKLAGLAVGLARPGGRVLAIKGATAEAELAKARPVLARLGVTDARVLQATGGAGRATATVVTFTAPEHRGSGAGGRRRAEHGGRGPSAPSGRAGAGAAAAGGRRARPNSRRGGG
ncbi:MAG TPA: 16S rRNA (guanine(527)-N(7))-methyltransferase RsmG [Streptosporangiaceae bacterium]|nr:16S rRNA (guanine(527)-N(7))-methyltransferase RsmG [Streptosporangiaceae bacterium]